MITENVPLLESRAAGDTSLLPFLDESSRESAGRDRGGISVGVSEYVSEGGVSSSGVNALLGAALGGSEGSDLSRCIAEFEDF